MKGVSLPFAIALIVVGSSCLVMGLRIEQSSLSGDHDPGPKMLPVALSGLLLLSGVVGAALRFVERREQAAPPASDRPIPDNDQDAVAGFGKAPAALGALLVYAIAIPWLGFQVSTFAFVTGSLMWLGARWWSSLLMAVVVIAIVRVVFGNYFYVQLPDGFFRLAF